MENDRRAFIIIPFRQQYGGKKKLLGAGIILLKAVTVELVIVISVKLCKFSIKSINNNTNNPNTSGHVFCN